MMILPYLLVIIYIEFTVGGIVDEVKEYPGRCLNATQICLRGKTDKFYNGCNNCFCYTPERPICTSEYCPPFKGTLIEYIQYCKKRLERRRSNVVVRN